MEKQGRRFADDKEATKVIEKLPKQPKPEKKQKAKTKKKPETEAKAQKPAKEKAKPQTKPKPAPAEPSEKQLRREAEKLEKQRKKDQRLKEKNARKLEKKLKKQRRRETGPNRETPVSEEKPESKLNVIKVNKKRIITAAVIVLLLFAVVFIISNPERFSWQSISNFFQYGILNRSSEESFPLDISGESISSGDFLRIGMDICYASDTKTHRLNNYGKTVFSVPHSFINPVLVTGKKNMLVYNLGGTGYQVIDAEHNMRALEAKDKILVADMTDSGIYGLVTQSGGYLSKLYVYDENDTQIFAYSFADYYVTAFSLCSNGRQAVVAGVSSSEGMDVSALYVLDFTKDTPVYLEQLENNIIYDVRYLNEKNACAVGRSASYIFNTANGAVETADYGGKSLTAYDINTDTDTYTLSLSGSGDGRNCDIISYNSGGKEDKSFHTEERIKDISTYKGRVALLTNDSVLLYSKDGGSISEKGLRSDPHTVVLYSGSDAYVLCTGYIDSIRL